MHATIVSSSSQVRWEVVLHVYNLSHVFHLMSNSLVSVGSHIDSVMSARSEVGDTRRVKILVLWGRTMTFELIELELILVRSSTDASLVDVVRSNCPMSFLLNELAVQ